jgi:anti-sigma factor RsiW
MMSCREVNRTIAAFLRGGLSAPQQIDFYRHLARCDVCAATVERTRDAMDTTRSACAALSDPGPGDVPDSLIQAILATTRYH